MGKNGKSPFCCWALGRGRRRRRASPLEGESAQLEEAEEEEGQRMPAPGHGRQNDQFHYFGIPLRTPAEYYHFLELPNSLGLGQQKHSGRVNVLGVGRRRRGGARLAPNAGEMLPNGFGPLGGAEEPDCRCTCSLPSISSHQCQQPLYGRVQVLLRKRPGQPMGLGIAGGADKPMGPTISYLRPGFVAQRCDQIQVGDRLVAVNGVRVDSGQSHSQVLSLLRNSEDFELELDLEYDLNGPELLPRGKRAGIGRRTAEIELREDGGAEEEAPGLFGMTIRGGAFGPDPGKSRPLTVTAIRPGGAAHREGRLRLGDRLVAVNGVSLLDSTLANALNLIRCSSRSALHLTIEYDVSTLAFLQRMPGPLLLEIEKVPGVDFGVHLAIRQIPNGRESRRRVVLVQAIVPASVADRFGAVQPGDELLAIDGISLELVGGLAEAYQLLRSQSAILRLELVPREVGRSRGERQEDPLRKANRERLAQREEEEGERPRSGLAGGEEQQRSRANGRVEAHGHGQGHWPKHRSESPRWREGSISARLSTGPGLLGSVSHVESMELALAQEAAQSWANFGIVLGRQRSKLEGEGEDGMPLVVAQIERGSPADKCGVLQPGDRILCINEWHTAEGSLHEAQHLLRALSLSGTRSSTLLVEFNLIEPVLPPSPGTLFIVRLAKRGNCLGIVCRSERKGAQKGEPLVISHIRVGSVAHRCGSIQVGDRVHSIDDIPLDACTVEEAMRLLQRSAQVVKLCIAKGGDQEQDLLDGGPQSVIYTVELARRGQPLGITIASAGSILDPIVISQLAPGGLAERTGALHVGDRILAVNGDTLEGKKVGQVTLMLQQCPDPVSLKLCRQMAILQEPFPHWRIPSSLAISSDPNASGIAGADGRKTPLKSLDSAMDSLEESPPSDGQQARHGTLKSMAHLRPSLCNNFHQADGISGGSSDPYSAGAGWDSGLSSAAATESQGGGGHQHARGTAQEKCCACQLGSDPSCSSNSPQSSAGSSSANGDRKEEWMRILEALETVGEEEMLRKLEESILTGQASNYVPPARTEHGQKNRQCHLLPSECGVLSKRFIPGCTANYSSALPNSFATQTANSTVRPSLLKKPAPMSPKPVRRSELAPQGQQQDVGTSKGEGGGRESQPGTPTPGLRRNGGFISAELPPPMPSPRAPSVPASFPVLASTFVPSENTSSSTSSIPFISSPVEKEPGCGEGGGPEEGQGEEDKFDELSEVFSVQLNRCPLTKSFGFSICDGPIGEEGGEAREEGEQRAQQPIGIYIRSVIREGPAEKSGRIRPGDRILQINARSIQFLTCDVVLPLLSTEKVDLLLLRRRQGRVARI